MVAITAGFRVLYSRGEEEGGPTSNAILGTEFMEAKLSYFVSCDFAQSKGRRKRQAGKVTP